VSEQGYFFRKDPGELAGMLSRLVAAPGEVDRIRKVVGEWTRRRYSWTDVVARYAGYFRELAAP